jgi:hypothetical protein
MHSKLGWLGCSGSSHTTCSSSKLGILWFQKPEKFSLELQKFVARASLLLLACTRVARHILVLDLTQQLL